MFHPQCSLRMSSIIYIWQDTEATKEPINKRVEGTSPAVPWLRVHLLMQGALIPGWGTRIPHAAQCSQKKKKIIIIIDEWIKKMWYIYITEYYSAMTKNKCLPFVTTQNELEGHYVK